jgi:hypothetical protein
MPELLAGMVSDHMKLGRIVLFHCARMENTLKMPSPTKLARLGHFPPAIQAGRRMPFLCLKLQNIQV